MLAHLFVEVYELLDDGTPAETDPLAAMIGIGTAVDLPDDPALARLLPDAHAEDPEASSEFRRYTEQGLRDRKRQCLEAARLSLGREGTTLTLDEGEGQSWLVALTDVRLVLAERMGLRTEEDHERLMLRLGIPLGGGLGDGLDDLPADDVEQGDDSPARAPGAGELLGQAVDETFGVDVEPEPEPEFEPESGRRDTSGTSGGHPAGSPTSDEALDEVLDDEDRAQLATMLSLYDFLTWLQETLVQAVTDD